MRRPWKEHALAYIKRTDRCPGEFPPFGLPDQVITEEEFLMSVKAGEDHAWSGCHFAAEIMGVSEVDAVKLSKKYQSGMSKTGHLKNELHKLVSQVGFRMNGSLYVPSELLNLEDYLHEFFSKKEETK